MTVCNTLLGVRLADKKTNWHRVLIPNWYGEGKRAIELCSEIAVWCHSGQPTVLLRSVLIRDPNGKFKAQALLCTDPSVTPEQIVQWFILPWQLEVTFAEVRAHLGVETQRRSLPVRQVAWYTKSTPTFAEALAIARQTLWQQLLFSMCKRTRNVQKISHSQSKRLTAALAYSHG